MLLAGKPTIGFVVVSHLGGQQLERLTHALNHVYDFPPIVCHHDTSQSSVNVDRFTPNVGFVENPVITGWGKWSIVEATLIALQKLYAGKGPDWFMLISAADYPTCQAEKVLSDFSNSGADALLDSFDLDLALSGHAPKAVNPTLQHHRSKGNLSLARARYLTAIMKIPVVRPRKKPSASSFFPVRLGAHTIGLPFASPQCPFTKEYRCYVGGQWFSGNRSVALHLINPTLADLRLRSYLSARVVPDECYVQTVLGNAHRFKIDGNTRRFTRWDGGGAHPKVLSDDDLPAILGAGWHFARKFVVDSPVLDGIDERLGIPSLPQHNFEGAAPHAMSS